MELKKIRTTLQFMTLLCAAALLAVTPLTARAQDFYGEGNVLIAVDMGPYAENEDVSYPGGTMGNLKWGADAPTGVSTRAQFNNKKYNPGNVSPVKAPDYEPEITYTVGQKLILPYYRFEDPDLVDTNDPGFDTNDMVFYPEKLPAELFSEEYSGILISNDDIGTDEYGNTYCKMYYEKTEDGSIHPCADFLAIECVAVTEYSTIWQYTGNAYSTRTGFDIREYGDAIGGLSDYEFEFFTDTCDSAYREESRIYGDPLWEDMHGDRDSKAAYVIIDLDGFSMSPTIGFYSNSFTDMCGFDCLFINAAFIPGRKAHLTEEEVAGQIRKTLIHELNHYIVSGCIGHDYFNWNMEMGECIADSAAYAIAPDSSGFNTNISFTSSYLQMIPGFLWNHGYSNNYPNNNTIIYTLGAHFLRYIEKETTGSTDGRLWTEYLAGQTPEGNITPDEISAFLLEKTGESIDAWVAQFMAAVVVGDGKGVFCPGDLALSNGCHIDPDVYFRSYEDYGKDPGISERAKENASIRHMLDEYDLTAIQGGGTAYAFRNDAGGRIAITGADENWYFFAVTMDLSPEKVIEIADAEGLAKIGNDPGYPLNGSYLLTSDIDLGGEQHPWTPIGSKISFTGEFNGNGHTISGLYINKTADLQGLFAEISGDPVIRDLTVMGEITGSTYTGGIVGQCRGGVISGCTSYVRLTGTGEGRIGGITGYVDYGTISDCTAEGMINGHYLCGGIAGMAVGAVIENCRSLTDVSGENGIGGICGVTDYSEIKNCENAGNISAEYRSGGIIGYSISSAINNCENAGNIFADDHSGGIIGLCSSSVINNCVNAGSVSADIQSGGIVGVVNNGSAVSNCHNTGTISVADITGGIAGYSLYTTFENNYHNSLCDVGCDFSENSGRIIETYTESDGRSIVFVFRIDSASQTACVKKVYTKFKGFDISPLLPGSDDTLYTVTSIAKGAFKNTSNTHIGIPETVNVIRANTFSDTAAGELIFTIRNASDLKIKKGAFNNMKRPRKTNIVIQTTGKKEFDKIVDNFKKAGGEKFKYEFRQLEE